jgi:predicted nucleic acid-binding protein
VIVVDASVLANALADDGPDGARARAVLRSAPDVATPDHANVEVGAVLRKRWIASVINDARLDQALADFVDLPIRRFPTLPLMARALELRDNLTVYDAVYVALAEALGYPLVTADAKMARASGPTCTFNVI